MDRKQKQKVEEKWKVSVPLSGMGGLLFTINVLYVLNTSLY